MLACTPCKVRGGQRMVVRRLCGIRGSAQRLRKSGGSTAVVFRTAVAMGVAAGGRAPAVPRNTAGLPFLPALARRAFAMVWLPAQGNVPTTTPRDATTIVDAESRRWLRWLTLAAAVLVAAWGSWCWLSTFPDAVTRLRDDAFYEFTWAANVAAGRGPSVSDGVTTSGVQVLWSLLLVPLAWLFGSAWLPVTAPLLGFAVHTFTAAAWFQHVRDRTTATCVALCWFGHPLLLREAENGQETALACLLASMLWFQRRAKAGPFLLVAMVAVLARTELWAIVLGLSLWRWGRHGVTALLAPALALVLHFAVNLLLGGGIVQDSALPMAWLWHANQAAAEPVGPSYWATTWWFLRPALLGGPFAMVSAFGIGLGVFLLLRPFVPASWRAAPAALVGCASAFGARDLLTVGWSALLLAVLPASRRRALPRALTFLLLGAVAVVFLHWAVRWYPRDYYLAPLVTVAMAALQRCGRHRLLLLAFVVAQGLDLGRVRPEQLGGQAEMELAGIHLAEVLPAGQRVGCFNSGLVTFHADVLAPPAQQRKVVNLDGVVDARSFAALQQARLGAHLDELGVRFVLDNAVQFELDPTVPHACGRWFGGDFAPLRDLVEVARFDVLGVDNGHPRGDSMRLFWRRGEGSPPPPQPSRDLGWLANGERVVLWSAKVGQTLVLSTFAGTRQNLCTADTATAWVLVLPGVGPEACELFVAGEAEPVLRLDRL